MFCSAFSPRKPQLKSQVHWVSLQIILFRLSCLPVSSTDIIIHLKSLAGVTLATKGEFTSSNIATSIAGNCVVEPSTLSKFPARRSKICGKHRHPHLPKLLAILPAILLEIFS